MAVWCVFKFSVKIWQTDSNYVSELMDCLAMVFVDMFSTFFNILCCFASSLVALNVRHLQLTLDWS
jgi:hypothetical protein